MSFKTISTKLAPEAVGTYSQGVEYNGVIYFSGQIGLDPKTMELQTGFTAQLNQVMKNIDGLLESQDLKRTNILKTTIFLTNLGNFGEVNKAYIEYFREPYPARSCVQAAALPKDAEVEIEVMAVRA
jgi:2-iminobutanoate/2-iminopropanoate deaminase